MVRLVSEEMPAVTSTGDARVMLILEGGLISL
jgi:hypothetical protein